MKPLYVKHSIPGVVWSHRSRSRPPAVPPGSSSCYPHTAGLVDVGWTDVVTQRERSATPALISGWKVTAVFLSGEQPVQK